MNTRWQNTVFTIKGAFRICKTLLLYYNNSYKVLSCISLPNTNLKSSCYVESTFSSVAQLCPILCDPMNCSMPDLPLHHHLPESTQTRVIESMMPSNHLILCRPLLLLPSIPPTIRVFSNESALCIQHHLLQKAFPDRPPSTETVFCTTLVALWNLLALALLTGGYVHLL